jgi:serine/threonine protein kinase/predicted ATPase/Tfp pilus assembly protein PilF
MKEGDVLVDRFVLEARAGAGGMGTIYRAFDRSSKRAVAVKAWTPENHAIPSTSDAPRERSHARFEHEVAALSAVQNSAVVRYVAHGKSLGGEPFLVMQWIDGQDLAAKIRGGGVSVVEALLLAQRLLPGLAALHARGIVHRDVKPANVMLEHGDVRRAVLVDLGVARRSEAAAVTVSGARVGTLCYMAPEQIRDARLVDGRADVFALGCILFECFTGLRAFGADDMLGAIAQILLEDPPDLASLRPELPASLVEWTRRLLARDRQRRPTVDAALREVDRLLEEARALNLNRPRQSVQRPSPPEPLVPAPGEPFTAPASSKFQQGTPELDAFSGERASRTSLLPARPLLGRELELSHLRGALAAGTAVIALWGPAGVGKTRLALECFGLPPGTPAFEHRWFVDLSGARDVNDALRVLASRLEARVRGLEAAELAVGRLLASHGQVLVVLDGVDAFAAAVAPLLDVWQRMAEGVRFMVTSRERLRMLGGLCLELGPLPVADRQSDTGRDTELSLAAQLFVECAREHGASLTLDGPARQSIERIVATLEGIPLAVELAASRVPVLGVEGVLGQLAEPLGLLAAPAGGSARNTMRQAIRASFDLLTSDERGALLQCSVFAGQFTFGAARAVVSPSGTLPLADVLQSLRDKSLLGSSESGVLTLSSVIREFASSELLQGGNVLAVRARHAAYFADRARALGSRRYSSQLEHLRQLEVESDDLLRACEYALAPDARQLALAVQTLLALELVILTRGPLPSFVELIDQALAAPPELRASASLRAGEARLLLLRARLRTTSARFDDAKVDLDRADGLAQELADASLQGSVWLERGVLQHFQRQLAEAARCYELALALIEPNESVSRGRCYGNLGAVLHDDGHLTQAAAHYWKAIQTLEETGEARILANFMGNLALIEQELGARTSAQRYYTRATALLRELGDARLHAIILGNQGSLQAELGAWSEARRLHELALELLLPQGDPYSLALCRARLGAALAMLGQLPEAEEQLTLAMGDLGSADVARLETIRLQRVFSELLRARQALQMGDGREAGLRLEQAEERCRQVERQQVDGRRLVAVSDDIRATLRAVRPLLAEVRSELERSA